MKNTKPVDIQAEIDAKIEEFRNSDYFKSMTGAEQERALVELRQEVPLLILARKRNYKRPLWENWFSDEDSDWRALSNDNLYDGNCVPLYGKGNDKPVDSKNPLLGGFGALGTRALAFFLNGVGSGHVEMALESFERYFELEMCVGDPKTAAELTPKQIAILELDDMLMELQRGIELDLDARSMTATAISFGAALMRLAIVFPAGNQDELFKMIKELPQQIASNTKKLLDEKKITAKLTAGPDDDFIFRRAGGAFWQIRWDGTELPPVPDSAGMAQICALLSNPLKEIPSLELHCPPSEQSPDAIGKPSGRPARFMQDMAAQSWSRQAAYDPNAVKAIRNRISEIKVLLAEPTTPLDERERLEDEHDKLVRSLKACHATKGAGGPEIGRADKRTAVKNSIDRAMAAIKKATQCDDLVRHLRNNIDTGRTCIYRGGHDWLT